MRFISYSCLILLSGLLCSAINGPSGEAQKPWKVPNGKKNDFTSTYRNGQTLKVAWEGWDDDAIDKYLNGKKENDLWVTSTLEKIVSFHKLLDEDVDVSKNGSYTWKINIADTALTKTAKYILRFKNPEKNKEQYKEKTKELSSVKFLVLPARAQSSISKPPDATQTATSDISAEPTATSTPTPSKKPDDDDDDEGGLSTGAKAGIGIGAAIGGGAVITVIVVGFLWNRRKKARENVSRLPEDPPKEPVYTPMYNAHQPYDNSYNEPAEAPDTSKAGYNNEPVEAPDTSVPVEPAELPGAPPHGK